MLVHVLKYKDPSRAGDRGQRGLEGSLGIARTDGPSRPVAVFEKILLGNMPTGSASKPTRFPPNPAPADHPQRRTARLGKPGDRLTIMSFTELEGSESQVLEAA